MLIYQEVAVRGLESITLTRNMLKDCYYYCYLVMKTDLAMF